MQGLGLLVGAVEGLRGEVRAYVWYFRIWYEINPGQNLYIIVLRSMETFTFLRLGKSIGDSLLFKTIKRGTARSLGPG